ncbi:hypothetical protein KK083_20755 [Fulvivirgaceae bacterium PWU4]|uniref:Uncharacterized protein n=1 Tax=Chryseosolibacter histidini TaxID=2782349 RepID=A0AAP2GKR7_9BACT|nr:hypothetical protein [Chryseosolibacter histidini]MBT1699339.1 hypothetical protein [Chryseosolibacter histidini]
MKKLIYTTLLLLATILSVTSCTEETVTPTIETDNGGGSGSTDPYKIK